MTKGFQNGVIGPKFMKKKINHVISREVLEHIFIKRENWKFTYNLNKWDEKYSGVNVYTHRLFDH